MTSCQLSFAIPGSPPRNQTPTVLCSKAKLSIAAKEILTQLYTVPLQSLAVRWEPMGNGVATIGGLSDSTLAARNYFALALCIVRLE